MQFSNDTSVLIKEVQASKVDTDMEDELFQSILKVTQGELIVFSGEDAIKAAQENTISLIFPRYRVILVSNKFENFSLLNLSNSPVCLGN